jgi:hypothetical protein
MQRHTFSGLATAAAAAGAATHGQHATQHRVQMSSTAAATAMTTAHASRIQPAVVGLPSQKKVAVHGAGADAGAAAGESEVSVV